MATGMLSEAVRRTLLGLHDAHAPNDGQLLERFVRQHDAAVFEALVQRHGSMVLRVCQRVLANPADADDAFQATFIVLLRKAESLAGYPSVAGWLHQVAYRIALKARRGAVRRSAHEQATAGMRPANTPAESTWDLRPVLDEELSRLPEKYRAPVVLCYLEGKTNDEAARQLGWTRGAVAGKLSHARDLLRERLARRGVVLSAGAVAAALAESASAAVHGAALRMLFPAGLIAGEAASARVELLAKGAIGAMLWAKLRVGGVVLAALLVLGTTAPKGSHRAGASADQANAARSSTTDFHVRWRFDNGPPKDIRVLDGEWKWEEAEGKKWMFARPNVTILLPTRTPNRPFVLSFQGTGIKARKDGRVILGLCPFWVDDRGTCARQVWFREGTSGPHWKAHCYFMDRWCAVVIKDDRKEYTHRIHRYRRPYAGHAVALRFTNTALEEIELRGLRPEEIPPWFRGMEKAAKIMANGPFEFGGEPIPQVGFGPVWAK